MLQSLERRAVTTRGLVARWLVLVLLTAASFTLATEARGGAASVVVISVAFFKVRLVGRHFMELHAAPAPLRVAFDAYVCVVLTTLVVLLLAV